MSSDNKDLPSANSGVIADAPKTVRVTSADVHHLEKYQKRFPPGKSGNPSGRPKQFDRFVKIARKGALESVQWVRLLRADARVPIAIRLEAAKWLADRGFGKAQQTIELTGENGGPLQVAAIDLSKLSFAEIQQLMVQSNQLPAVPEIIDVTPGKSQG